MERCLECGKESITSRCKTCKEALCPSCKLNTLYTQCSKCNDPVCAACVWKNKRTDEAMCASCAGVMNGAASVSAWHQPPVRGEHKHNGSLQRECYRCGTRPCSECFHRITFNGCTICAVCIRQLGIMKQRADGSMPNLSEMGIIPGWWASSIPGKTLQLDALYKKFVCAKFERKLTPCLVSILIDMIGPSIYSSFH